MDVAGTGALLLLYVLFILFVFAFKMYKKQRQLPPGPSPWLFLGNLLQKNILPLYDSYVKLVQKYGPVFTVWMGPKPIVILCGYEVVKDALLGHAEEFGGRPDIPIKIPGVTGQGFEVTNEKKRRAIHWFSLSTLKDFGMGKRKMSERVQEEAVFLVEEIAATQGQPFDPRGTIRSAVSNVFCSVILGCRFDSRDKFFIEQLQFTTDFIAFFRSFFGVGTPVIPLLYSLHFDPLEWETPEEFNPGHFLDENGKFRKRDAFMPFSAGKWACPGEALAQMKLFLFLTTLLQYLTFQLTGEAKEKDLLSLSVDLNTNSLSPPL